jgi:hypothetical protein
MEIIYSNATYGTLNISTRLPYEGETLEQLVEMYAPISYWLEQDRKPIQVKVGTIGMSSRILEPTKQPITWLSSRIDEYGTVEQQLEFITERGLEAWQSNVAAIKEKYPKPTED